MNHNILQNKNDLYDNEEFLDEIYKLEEQQQQKLYQKEKLEDKSQNCKSRDQETPDICMNFSYNNNQHPTLLYHNNRKKNPMSNCAFQEYLEIQTVIILILMAIYEISLLLVPEWRVKIEEKKLEQNDNIKKELTQEREENKNLKQLNEEESSLKNNFLKQTSLLGTNLTNKEQDEPEQRKIINQTRIIQEQQKNRKQVLEHKKLKMNIGLWILLKLMISKPVILTILFLTAFSSFKVSCQQLDGEDFDVIKVNKEVQRFNNRMQSSLPHEFRLQ
ncbi:hypothetical protein PPERSA_05048 [Pseudocohnilembus persalinus]|uniref:Transmembrane protein n=1 Tax=Pseudocohnilembus persalinus TaxID=266149 RepID=A0A0V0QVJ7_PSEPJ|nr:hypothetical protein PPERSA_05048 [Pseudocohnilembus persalinus]|eukprot:KRX06435.1 hypothetical protein PPERSA_05048 [Pseudocohnilembus persalinus]